jgi:hypothetical protein
MTINGVIRLNKHLLKTLGLKIGRRNHRLNKNADESRWFVPRAERSTGGLKLIKLLDHRSAKQARDRLDAPALAAMWRSWAPPM